MSYLLLLFQGNINEYIYIAIIGITIVLAEITNIEETSFTQDIVDEIEKGKALKRYLEDYSLIDKKEIEHIKLWEGFLVYAIILDSASNVKKFFDNIFK